MSNSAGKEKACIRPRPLRIWRRISACFSEKLAKEKGDAESKHRHRAGQLLHKLEKLGDINSIEGSTIEVTADQLKKIDAREKLGKWGVQSLREYVERNEEIREERAFRRRQEWERIETRCITLIRALERNPGSPEAQELLREIPYGDWHLRLFLKRNPEWEPRLRAKLLELKRIDDKTRMKEEKKQSEKKRTKKLLGIIQKQTKAR